MSRDQDKIFDFDKIDKEKGLIVLVIFMTIGGAMASLRRRGTGTPNIVLNEFEEENRSYLNLTIDNARDFFQDNEDYQIIVYEDLVKDFVTERSVSGEELLRENFFVTFEVEIVPENNFHVIEIHSDSPGSIFDFIFGQDPIASKEFENNYDFIRT